MHRHTPLNSLDIRGHGAAAQESQRDMWDGSPAVTTGRQRKTDRERAWGEDTTQRRKVMNTHFWKDLSKEKKCNRQTEMHKERTEIKAKSREKEHLREGGRQHWQLLPNFHRTTDVHLWCVCPLKLTKHFSPRHAFCPHSCFFSLHRPLVYLFTEV